MADLADDYQNATAVGNTTEDAGMFGGTSGLSGTVTGAWNYYSDDDGVIDGDELLLTFVNAVGGTASNGAPGFVGTNNLFAPGNGLGNFPVVSSGLVFLPQFVPALTPGVLQVHPGDPGVQGNPILAIKYEATAGLQNVTLNYQVQAGADGIAHTDHRIIQIIGGNTSTIVDTTAVTGGNGTGIVSVGAQNMSPGDSIWMLLDSGFSGNPIPNADATNLGLQIVADPTDVMKLRVDTNSGLATLVGPDNVAFSLNGYSVSSPSGQLAPGGWSSLADRVPDFGNGSDSDLVGWDPLGSGSANQVGEFRHDGSDVFGLGGTSEISLGNIFTPGGTQDLQLSVSIDGIGNVVLGEVEYVSNPGVVGDYNNDGVVNLADYTVWRNNLGGSSLPNEGATPGIVDQQDYDVWKSNFGQSAAASLGSSQVPEPSTLLILLPLAAIAWQLSGRGTSRHLVRTIGVTAALVLLGGVANAARTLDRDYQLGDDSAEGAMVNTTLTEDTFDTTGTQGAGDFQDISPAGDPRYVDVSGRPYAGASQLGIEFDGTDDYLFGLQLDGIPGLGYPGAASPPNPNADYTGISERGIQAWVMPTASGTAQRQDIINDTYQFGIHITDDDTWAMTWGSASFATTAYTFESSEAVAFNTWTHVQQHSFGNTLGVLYVDGQAVLASSQGLTYSLFAVAEASYDITVGASLALDGAQPFTGTLDDIELYVAGENTAMDYGTFDPETDNEYIAGFLADGGYSTGDLNGDGQVTDADVNIFLSNWNNRNMVNGAQVGDLDTRLEGDFNYDGLIGIQDWAVIRDNHVNAGSLASLGQLLSGQQVPEPGTAAIAVVALAAVLSVSRCKRLVVALLAAVLCVAAVDNALAIDLWNVDFQGNAGGTTFGQDGLAHPYGPDPQYGVFNHFEVESLNIDEGTGQQIALSNNPSLNLVDSTGAASSVTVTLNGMVGGWNGAAGQDFLSGDYFAVLPSGGDIGFQTGAQMMTITGLMPGELYTVRFDTGPALGRDVRMTLDTDGDGSLANNTPTVVPSFTQLYDSPLFSFTADATGSFIAEFTTPDNATGEADISGMQLTRATDFDMKLTVDRSTGGMVLSNNTVNEYQLTTYSVRSDDVGALDPSTWLSVAENYDSNNGGEVDGTSSWTEFTNPADRDNLSEGQDIGGEGALFANGDSIDLGNAWIRNPTEDLTMQLLVENELGDSELVEVAVEFTGSAALVGDFDFANGVDPADWAILQSGFSSDVSNLSLAEKYQMGDINQDGAINLLDAKLFAVAYDDFNGPGSFASLGSSAVPEPATVLLLATTAAALVIARTRHTEC